MRSGLEPSRTKSLACSQGFAPGWYEVALSALGALQVAKACAHLQMVVLGGASGLDWATPGGDNLVRQGRRSWRTPGLLAEIDHDGFGEAVLGAHAVAVPEELGEAEAAF
jgi:hypothetical protein